MAVLATLLDGCGRKAEFTYPHTNLGGEVTIDGSPIDVGMISFLSLNRANGQEVTTRVVRGRYIVEKVPLGKVLVVISAFEETGRMSDQDGRSSPELTDIIPPKYQSGFELDVLPSTNRVDFRMKRERTDPGPSVDELGPG